MAKAYIDREKAIAYVEEQYRLFKDDESKQAIVEGCVEALKFTPTADVVEVKHGHWRQNRYCERIYHCSVCGRHIEDATKNPYEHFPYCHCGAKMNGGKAE